jgi:hypothetical protein
MNSKRRKEIEERAKTGGHYTKYFGVDELLEENRQLQYAIQGWLEEERWWKEQELKYVEEIKKLRTALVEIRDSQEPWELQRTIALAALETLS